MTLQRTAFFHPRGLALLARSFAATALLAWLPATAPEAAAPPAPDAAAAARSAALTQLLRGSDARAAVAEAVALDASGDASQAQRAQARRRLDDNSAAAGFARSADTLRRALAAAQQPLRRGAAPNYTALLAALDAQQAQRLLLQLQLEKSQKDTKTQRGDGNFARSRQAELGAWLARLGTAADSLAARLRAQPPGREAGAAVFAELQDLLAADAVATPVYGNGTLPVHRPRLPTREPVLTPAVVPSYADAQDPLPQPADLASTAEAPLSAAVLAKAQSLDYDYSRILDFVRSQVKTHWYAGAQQDADTTLRTLSGNDIDQASLLIALLRASRAPARYVRGVVEVEVEALGASLGVREDKIGLALAAAGVAQRPVLRGGRIAAYAIEHVFVSAYLPFSHYRGSAADLSGKTWVPLAPALKPHRLVPAGAALARSGIDANAFIDDHLSQPRSASPLERLRERVSSGLSALTPPLAYADQLAQHEVDAPALQLLPASLPATTLAVTGEFAELPDDLRQQLRIVLHAGSDSSSAVVFERQWPVAQLAGRRISLSYQPFSIEDGAVVDARGGVGATPPYLFRVRPVLLIDGQPAAVGASAIDAGALHRLVVTAIAPGGSTRFSQQLTAAGYAALAVDTQADAELPAPEEPLPNDNEQRAARVLANLGARYLSQWNRADEELARLAGVALIRPFPSAVLVLNQYQREQAGGLVQRLRWRGVALDAALRPVEAFTHTADNRAESDWTALSALQGSSLEHRLFEEQWHVDSISADKGLALARAQGAPVLSLTPASGSSGLNQPADVIAAVNAWLQRGYVVDIVKNPLTQGIWTGAVWRVRNLPTGEAGYFISGALAGGSTAMPPELWYLQDLPDWLGDPYGKPANDDPDAGVIVTLDATTQDQRVTAGEATPLPLRAYVLDSEGRPVKGARVTFAPPSSNGNIVGAAQGASLIVATDATGKAEVRYATGARIRDNYYTSNLLLPMQEEPVNVGVHRVEVSVASSGGTRLSGEPFRVYALPGPPTRIRLDAGENVQSYTGIGEVRIYLDVFDANENPVSNAPLNVDVQTQFLSPNCPLPPQRREGVLFVKGDCPNEVMLLGNACATAPLRPVVSRAPGLDLRLVPSDIAMYTRYIVTASTGGITSNTVLYNDSSECRDSGDYERILFFFDDSERPSAHIRDLRLNKAAPLNALFPVGGRVELWSNTPGSLLTSWSRRPMDNLVVFSATNGSIENLQHNSGAPGITRFDIRAGSTPGPIDVRFQVEGSQPYSASRVGWAIEPQPPRVEPTPVELTPFSTLATPLTVLLQFEPVEYTASNVVVGLLADDAMTRYCQYHMANNIGGCNFTRGTPLDRSKDNRAFYVLNEGTPYRIEMSAPLPLQQGIIAGYGVLPSGSVDPVALLQNRLPKHITLRQDIEISAGYACTKGHRLGYLLSQDAKVTLGFFRQNAQGGINDTPTWEPLSDEPLTAGAHDVAIDPRELPPGEYVYQLIATNAQGEQETHYGVASNTLERHDALTLSHPFVKGVDLFSGAALIGEEDVAIDGRGPGIRLERSYYSHNGEELSFLGRGWSSALDGQVKRTECDERIVVGIGGQGQRFRPAGQLPDGSQSFTALNGYHGTLLQRGNTYDFHSREGLHYHYGQPDLNGPRISYVEDANGNRVSYTWEMNLGKPRITAITDSAGRRVDLAYTLSRSSRVSYGIAIEETAVLLKELRGPLGLVVRYEYDERLNLKRVTREDASTKGRRISGYTYENLGGQLFTQPDGKISYTIFGHRLKTVVDEIGGGVRRYEYELGWSGARSGEDNTKIVFEPEQRVKDITEPDLGKTGFVYTGIRGLFPVTTDVTDARNKPTHYAMNLVGGAETVSNEIASTSTLWNLQHRQPQIVTDAEGAVTTYGYDSYGNKTSEVIVHPQHGRLERSWTWYPPSAFTTPYLIDRVETATDARGIVTTQTYDPRGNLRTTTRGGVQTSEVHDPKGDRVSVTDGEAKTWDFKYDTYGYLETATSPLRHVTTTRFDALGRKRAFIDANTYRTEWDYDARNRVVETRYPGNGGKELRRYEDTDRRLVITNPRNFPTTQTFDRMGRLLDETVADGTRSLRYDENGNVLEQIDFGGHKTSFLYDALNRVEYRHEWADDAVQRTTVYAYDKLGNVLSEKIGKGPEADEETRRREYRYEHPTYSRTHVRRELVTSNGSRWIEEVTGYDGNGNVKSVTDARGHTTTREYDERDRLKDEFAPLGKTISYEYDGRDKRKKETRLNASGSGTQVREWKYDDDGRETQTIDALGKSRYTEYDNVNNVSARVDALGYRTRYEYDERNNLAAEFGPEAGQETRYEYDPNNNRNKEIWPNGRVVSISYDARDRRHVTSDQRGVVETRSWWPDGPLKSVTDADGRVTRQFHDGLHRLFREELPGLPLRARTFGHSIHGEVVSETDARQHLTTHEVDTLGRRTASILPAVDNVTARLETQYDDAGNIERQIDGRGIVTAFVHNALNQRTDQTDTQTCSESGSGGDACHQSWTYDTQGNVITHTDRRGIVSVSSHDLENRLLTHSRDGVLQQRIERDDQGNVHFQWDAEGRKTTFGYDKAHRKTSEDRSGLALETWTYTPLGDLDTHTDADGYQTVRHYDLRRQLDEETRAGETTVYTYYDAGQRKTLQRPNGAPWTWHYGYDSAGRLHTVTSPEGHETTFGYDAADNRDSITDARQHETTFAYDGRNRLSGKTYPGGKNWQWRYDAANNRIRTEAPNGRISTTDYDNLQRPTLTQYLDAPTGEVQQTQSRYDGNGNPRSVIETSSSGTRSETRHYDRFDRADEVIDGDGRTLSYRYDKAGNRTERTDHDQQTTVWHYNALNQNDRVFTPGLGTTEQKHTPGGRLDLVTRPDGSLTDYGYTVTGRLETIAHQKAGNAIANYRYTYDPNGNRTLQQETNGAVSGGVTQDTTYLYDHDDRLTEVHEPGRNTIYTLDPVGNRTGEEVRNGSGTLISHSTLIYNDRDQLTSRTDPVAGITLSQTWDDNGNLATQTSNGQTRTYSYDARDRLTALALPSAPSLSFRYHANGLRREKTDGIQTTRYHYDDQSLLAETNAIGNTQRQYHYSADQLIAQTEAGTTPTHRQYLLDGLRSPIALLTSQGAVSARTSYDAFGEIRAQQKTGGNLVTPLRDQANAALTNEDEQPFGFTGYLKDGESGLYYAKARYYDPATARFTTEDPEAGKDLEPPSLHRYLYAYANPLYYVDPDGRQVCGECFGIAHAKNDADKSALAEKWLDDKPPLAAIAAALVKVHNFSSATVGWASDAAVDYPEAKARQAARIDSLISTLRAFNERAEYHFKRNPSGLPGAFAADALASLGTRTGENIAEAKINFEKEKYFRAWSATYDVAGNAAEIATVTSIAKPTAFVVTEFRTGRAALRTTAAEKSAIRFEQKMAQIPDDDFRLPVTGPRSANTIDDQILHAANSIPGLDHSQARALLEAAFSGSKPTPVVIGGSRIRAAFRQGIYREDSDLDIGFDATKMKNQDIARILDAFDSAGKLKAERGIKIFSGNNPKSGTIESPQSFFQKSGKRSDPGREGEPYGPSGYFEYRPDGTIVTSPPRKLEH